MKSNPRTNAVAGFQVIEKECIWMKAGVISFRNCDNDYDCARCPFDQGMRRAMGKTIAESDRTESPEWVQQLKARFDAANRPCRHVLTGRIEGPKICPYNYECYHCAFDQMLDDIDLEESAPKAPTRLVSGVKMADGYYYHFGHGWARFEHGGMTRVGCDDFVVRVFGRLNAGEMPPLGSRMVQGQVGWTLARGDRQAAMLAPVTGRVLAVNHQVAEHPELMTETPYQNGWLFIIEPDNPKRNLKELYFGRQANLWIEREQQELQQMADPDRAPLAATGGRIINDFYGRFPGIGWDRLVSRFLHTRDRDGRP
jgi:glycine cleavage system H lipoate-binding protein